MKSTLYIDKNGNRTWLNKNGDPHRIGGPAIEEADGSKYWYLNGQLHSKDYQKIYM